MRLHRFYIEEALQGREIIVTEERLLKQWRSVLWLKEGDRVVLFDGKGKEYLGEVESLKAQSASLRILEEKEGIVPERKIILCQSIIKKDKMEWVVEKATELGVSKIIPILSERSEKKGFNIERARKIAIEAAEQCGRADVPEISEIMNLEVCITKYEKNAVVFDPSGVSLQITGNSQQKKLLSDDCKLLTIFIGPEGGWSEKEIERFSHVAQALRDKKETKIEIFSLGKLTLRAETAAVTALSLLSLQ